MRGLHYISWNDHSGYAVAARRYLAALAGAEVPLTWTPMVPGKGWGPGLYSVPFSGTHIGGGPLAPYCNQPVDYDTVLVHLVPEYFPGWREREPGKRLIGYTTWETDRLPSHWPELLNLMHEIWVPSTWNRDVFRASGVTVPVRVVPHILWQPPSAPAASLPELNIPAEHRVIYCIGQWTRRKAMDVLLETYWRTFSSSDPVTLVLKTGQQDITHPLRHARFPLNLPARVRRTVRRLARPYPDRPSTVLLTGEKMPQSVIDSLHARGDIYLSLSHAEGWGLGAFDAVAAGNPVIMTGYGGALDFLPADSAALVDRHEVRVEDDDDRNFDGPAQHWAAPDTAHAGEWMRRLVEDPGEARRRGLRLRDHARRHFDKATVLRTMLRHLTSTRGSHA